MKLIIRLILRYNLFATSELQNIRIRILQIFDLIFLMNLQQTIWGKYKIKIYKRLCDSRAIGPTFDQAKKS